MRIDAHIHYTPPSLAADLDAFVRTEPFWGLMLAPGADGKSVQGWATAERMIEDMDAAGIDKAMLMGEYRRTHEGCVARNNQALEILRRWPDRVIAFAMIQPKAGPAALDELARCLDGGMAGVGELGPYGQGYRLDDPDFLRLAEACIRYDIPLNLHTNEEVGHFYPGKAATPLLHIYRLAACYPELKLILAHWGGGLLFYELMPEVRHVLRNVWYDTAGTPLLFPTRAIFDVALRCIDHRKLLYGSDYPLRLYPRRQLDPDFRPFLAEIDALELAPDVRADIMGRNAACLLGLSEPAALSVVGSSDLTPFPPALRIAGMRGSGDGATETIPSSPNPRQFSPPVVPRSAWASSLQRKGKVRFPLLAEVPCAPHTTIEATMSTVVVAATWPETRAVFARHGIPCDDCPVPFWEPIAQAAAARGLGPDALARLVAELNEAVAGAISASGEEESSR